MDTPVKVEPSASTRTAGTPTEGVDDTPVDADAMPGNAEAMPGKECEEEVAKIVSSSAAARMRRA